MNGCAIWWICSSAAKVRRSSTSTPSSDLYQDQVFCFSPKGMLIALPRGATPIDFAYFVHTDVGNTAVGAKVNGVHTPLHTPLKNGDQVEIICSKEQTPSPLWERFVVTGRARAEIRRYLRHAQRDQHVALGRKILEKAFSDEGHELTDKAVEGVLKKLRLAKPEDVYADVGRGALRADEVLAAVYPQLKRDPKRKRPSYIEPNSKGVSIAGLTEGIGYRLGACCHPIPGDRIIGLMVPGEGVVIHTIDCEVLDRHQDSMADWIDVRWKDHVGALSVARIMVRLKNETGALATLANVIGQNGANISNLKITSRNPLYFEFQVDVEVGDAAHLENLIRALKVDFDGRSGRTRRAGSTPTIRARARNLEGAGPASLRARETLIAMNRLRLGVNIDHVATLRNARGSPYPDPLRAAEASIAAGADIITAHLREDRRHIRDEDVAAITAADVPLNLEMGATEEMLEIALRTKPRACCLVPERREEVTTEHGLDVAGLHNRLAPLCPPARRLPSASRSSSTPMRRRSMRLARSAFPTSSCTPAPMPKRCSRATRTRSATVSRRCARARAGRPPSVSRSMRATA